MTTDKDTGTEEEEKDPWMPMVEEAMQKHKTTFEEIKMNLMRSGLDEQSAEEIALMFYPCPKRNWKVSRYMERLLWMKQHTVHKKIMQTKDAFVDNDDFDQEKAM